MEGFDDFTLITQLTRREIIHVLESINGTKELIVEPNLTRPLDKIASMSLLHEHNCIRVQQLHMDRAVFWDQNIESRVFLIRPSIATIRKVCEVIKSDPHHPYFVVYVDRRLNLCELEIERNGVYGLIESYELNLSLIPLESDLFSLELPQSSTKSSTGETHSMAKCLWQLQSLYGSVPTVYGVGPMSQEVDYHLKTISTEQGEPPASADQPISHVFLFDRQMDIISVLLTGLTYESMLNDVFNYSCGKIVFGDAVENKLKQKTPGRAVSLNNSDPIFSAIRNKHMTEVFPFLSAKAKTLQTGFDKASVLHKVEDVKEFVSNELKELKQNHRLLELHICACEVVLDVNKGSNERFTLEHGIVQRSTEANDIMNYLETCICRQQNPWQVLQLACLWSLCENGLSTKHYNQIRSLFLQAYGYDYLPVLYQLSLSNLLVEKPVVSLPIRNMSTSQSRYPPFSQWCKALNLTPEQNEKKKFDSSTSTQMSYVFSEAYNPMICQILANTVNEGWNIQKLQKALGQNVFCTNPTKPDNRIRKAILLCFVGGVTFAEIAAIRSFAQNNNFRIIILTTHIIQREEFLKSFTHVI